MSPRIVVVEDDHLQEGPLEEELLLRFPDARIQTMCTESEFRARLGEMRESVPDVVIMDVMLRWAFPSPDAPPMPEDVETGGHYRAGLRCVRLLAEDDVLRDVPVLLLTILERADLERIEEEIASVGPDLATAYVRKSADFGILTRKVSSLLGT
jgi:CheY-like chemotaxis protein